VTSPATSKNAICVGATQTSNFDVASTATRYVTFEATVTEGSYSTSFKVVQVSPGLGGAAAVRAWVDARLGGGKQQSREQL
jgi:hypothetical protein